MLDSVFKVYDIRGVVHTDFLLDAVYNFGCVFVLFCKRKCPDLKTIVIGRDGRLHSEKIYQELVRACTDMGVDVCTIGVCCTPVLYFSLHKALGQAGIMITASHNGPEYNGLKLCLGTESIWGEDIQEIKHEMIACSWQNIERGKRGIVFENMMAQAYCSYLVEEFAHLKNLATPLVIDCANGAGATIIPHLVERMGWANATVLYSDLDGAFPNHEADPTIYENMKTAGKVLQRIESEQRADGLAIGLDGDCDRMGALCTTQGKPFLIPGDHLFALFVSHAKKYAQYSQVPVICDIKFSQAVLDYFLQSGVKAFVSPSGHSIIKQKIKDNGALFAGELSCHFFFKDRYFGYDDGIYAMLRLIELVDNAEKPLAELCRSIPTSYTTSEMRIACTHEKKSILVGAVYDYFSTVHDAKLMTIDGVRVCTSHGIGLIRASHTQPVISLRFESQTKDGLSRIQKQFYAILVPLLGKDVLQKYL